MDLARQGIVDVLEAYGYVDGENIELIFANAEGDFPTITTIIESFLDEGVDVIMPISTPVAAAALNVTTDLEGPPIIFNTVTNPYAAGIASTPCIHPAWVTGSQALPPYAEIIDLVYELVPDLESVGYIYNTAEPNAVASTEIVTAIAEEIGMDLRIQTIADATEVGTAAEALAADGVDIFLTPTDSTVGQGMPGLLAVAEEYGVPVFHSDAELIYAGVTAAAGVDYYQGGVESGIMLVQYLKGNLDISRTAIHRLEGTALGVNLDAAAAQGVEIPEEFLAKASNIIENGEASNPDPALDEMSMEDREAADTEFMAGLQCTDEMIAEQQAELDASE